MRRKVRGGDGAEGLGRPGQGRGRPEACGSGAGLSCRGSTGRWRELLGVWVECAEGISRSFQTLVKKTLWDRLGASPKDPDGVGRGPRSLNFEQTLQVSLTFA